MIWPAVVVVIVIEVVAGSIVIGISAAAVAVACGGIRANPCAGAGLAGLAGDVAAPVEARVGVERAAGEITFLGRLGALPLAYAAIVGAAIAGAADADLVRLAGHDRTPPQATVPAVGAHPVAIPAERIAPPLPGWLTRVLAAGLTLSVLTMRVQRAHCRRPPFEASVFIEIIARAELVLDRVTALHTQHALVLTGGADAGHAVLASKALDLAGTAVVAIRRQIDAGAVTAF